MRDTLAKSLIETVERLPGKTALEYKENGAFKSKTYRDLWLDIRRFSRGLWTLGVRAGDRVALISENRPEWAITDWATICLGAVTVPIFPTLTVEQIAFILCDAQPKAVVVGDLKLAKKVSEALAQTPIKPQLIIFKDSFDNCLPFKVVGDMGETADLSDSEWADRIEKAKGSELVTLIYTSGTTGEPKGVMLTHANFLTNARDVVEQLPITQEDKFFNFLPLNHVVGRFGDHFLPALLGATTAYAESLATLRNDIVAAKPTIVLGVPRFYESVQRAVLANVEKEGFLKKLIFKWSVGMGRKRARAIMEGRQPGGFAMNMADKLVGEKIRARFGGRIRFLVAGGAALPRDTAEFFLGFGLIILEGYGLTETSCLVSINHPGKFRFGTVGIPMKSTEVKIADDGEILVRGFNIMRGYFNNEEATKEAVDEQGYFHTGDIGEFRDGFLKITDRKKDLLVLSNGKNVAPQPIENQLKCSNFIEEAVVLGDGQNIVTALIVPSFEVLKPWLRDHKLPADPAAAVKEAKLRDLLKKEVEQVNKSLAEFERVKRFELLSAPFTVEGGELTPTLKVKRRAIREKYADLIRSMAGE